MSWCIYKNKNTVSDIDPLHHVTYAPAKFEVSTSSGLGDVFTKKYIIKITQKVAQYLSSYYDLCAPAKFEVAMSNSLGGNALTRKKH